MSDRVSKILAQFQPAHRYANFGPALRSMSIEGIRGLSALTVDMSFPITALSGCNGAGKSTIAQLAVCAYRAPSTAIGYRRYYVKDFFPYCIADPDPFLVGSRVKYVYETTDPMAPQDVTVSRAVTEWSGYKRQPERQCYYVGFTLYIPKVERRDLSIYRAHVVQLGAKRVIPDHVRALVSVILGSTYDEMSFQRITHGTRGMDLGMATRYGRAYSENNMGFGEGRVFYMVDLLENAPAQSLVVLEEPETSLHEQAQYQLAKYLLDVVLRRHHQVLLSTHSSTILSALPPEARKYLHRDVSGLHLFNSISSAHARALLSAGRERALIVCVEDDFARQIIVESVRRIDTALVSVVDVKAVGSTDAVREAVKLLLTMKRRAIGIRDGDVGGNAADKLFSLPGTRPPETEVYTNEQVRARIQSDFGVDVGLLMAEAGVDIHEITSRIARASETPAEAIQTAAIKEYIGQLPESPLRELVETIRREV